MDRIRAHLSFANCMSLIALFIALGGTSFAVAKGSIGSGALRNNGVRSVDVRNNDVRGKDIRNNDVRGKDIRNNDVRGKDIRAGAVTSSDVLDGSLVAGDLAPGQLPAGPRGPAGAQGPQGLQGPAGSPDTGAQILTKLAAVDGPGSGLDADSVDGMSSDSLVPLVTATAGPPAVPVRFYSYFMTTTSTNRLEFGQMALQAAGAAGQFRICGNTGGAGPLPWVLYLNGVRSTGTVNGNACTAPFDAGAGGEFQVTIRRSIVFGVHSGDGLTNENYNVYGFGQL